MNLGVIGCGYWGPKLIRNLFASGRCDSIHCFDSKADALHRMLLQFPSLIPASGYEELLGICDAIMIATPVSSHFPLACRALDAGKGVFVEKPLATSFQEGEFLVDLAARKHIALMTGHTFLYSPAVKKIRQYISDGTLGEVLSIRSSRINLGIHRQDVNVIWDLAPHDVSMLLYWLGEAPSRVSASGHACIGQNIDTAHLHLKFSSGAVADLDVSWLSASKTRLTEIIGRSRMVSYNDVSADEKLKLSDASAILPPNANALGEARVTYRNGDMLTPKLESTEPLLAQTHAFLDWVEHKVVPENNTWIALQVISTLEAACRSLLENGRLVEVGGSKFGSRPMPRPTVRQSVFTAD